MAAMRRIHVIRYRASISAYPLSAATFIPAVGPALTLASIYAYFLSAATFIPAVGPALTLTRPCAPSPVGLAASSWSTIYNFVTLTLTLTLPLTLTLTFASRL